MQAQELAGSPLAQPVLLREPARRPPTLVHRAQPPLHQVAQGAKLGAELAHAASGAPFRPLELEHPAQPVDVAPVARTDPEERGATDPELRAQLVDARALLTTPEQPRDLLTTPKAHPVARVGRQKRSQDLHLDEGEPPEFPRRR